MPSIMIDTKARKRCMGFGHNFVMSLSVQYVYGQEYRRLLLGLFNLIIVLIRMAPVL